MKKLVTIIVLFMSFLSRAQISPAGKIFDGYSGKKGYTSVYVTRAMFEIFEAIDNDKDDKDFKDITSKLNSIKILSVDSKDNPQPGNAFYKELVKAFAVPDYQDLMIINDEGEEIKFLIRKRGDMIAELIMIVGGKEPCLIVLDGDINLKQVAKLSKSMNIKGLDHLNEVNPKKQ